jgi:phage terminase large subunit-like protein
MSRLLRHSKGRWAGKPFALLPWQWEQLIAPLFGWRRDDGSRRFRQAYVEIPKKNGKSTLCAALGLYLLIADGEASPEVYSAASDREQANIVHGEASRMVEASRELADNIVNTPSRKTLAYPHNHGVYKAISADGYRNEGLNIHGLLFDELHAQPDRRLWDALKFGGAARSQPLTIAITTAGYDRESICWEQHEYARQVEAGTLPDWEYLPLIYAADAADDPFDPAIWAKANPSMGETVIETEFARAATSATHNPRELNAFLRYRLNIWTEQADRWIDLGAWDACGDMVPDDVLSGCPCYAGVDLSTRVDITAVVLCWVLPDGRYAIRPWMWVPDETVRKREHTDRASYTQWVREGYLMRADGPTISYPDVRTQLRELHRKYNIREIAIDPYNAHDIGQQLIDEDGFRVVEFRQGYLSMSAPCKAFEAAILELRLLHGGHPVLRWMAGNAATTIDPAGNVKPAKNRSGDRIDGIVAAIMALARAQLAQEPTSVYETRGPLIL